MNNLSVALVLGGGFAKGAYQFGFLKSLLRYLPEGSIRYISASSVGVLNGYALSASKTDVGENLWRTKNFGNIFEFFKLSWKDGAFGKIVDAVISDSDFLAIPLMINLCQFPKIQELYLELSGQYKQFWKSAVKGSISFPVVSKKPTRFFKKYYMDGGFLDNIPLGPALNTDVDMIIVLHCDARYLPIEKSYYRNKIILDVDVSAKSTGILKTFDIKSNSLNKMVDEGEVYGEELGSFVFPCGERHDFYSVRERTYEFLKRDYKNRKNKQSLDTIGTVINELYCWLFLEDSELYKI